MNPLQKVAYVCSKCGAWYSDELAATRCCSTKTCEDCGCELPPKHYYTVCDYCREQRKFNEAKKLSVAQYIESYPNSPLYTPAGEFVFSVDHIEDWESYHEGPRPAYFYGAKHCFITIDPDRLIDQLNNIHLDEDCDLFTNAAYKEIYDFCTKWNSEHRASYFEEDSGVAVLAPEEV